MNSKNNIPAGLRCGEGDCLNEYPMHLNMRKSQKIVERRAKRLQYSVLGSLPVFDDFEISHDGLMLLCK